MSGKRASDVRRRRDDSKNPEKTDDEEKTEDEEIAKKKFKMGPIGPGRVNIQIPKDKRKVFHKEVCKMERPGVGAEAHVSLSGGMDVSCGTAGVIEMIDTFDRPGKAFAVRTYSGAGKFAEAFTDKPGKRIPKAGLYAGAGVGHARAEWSVFDAEAKGPNAAAGVGASAASMSARAFATAEVASASATAGPLKATAGLSADTGVGVGVTGVEAKILGTGFSFGRKMGISLFGTGFEFNLW